MLRRSLIFALSILATAIGCGRSVVFEEEDENPPTVRSYIPTDAGQQQRQDGGTLDSGVPPGADAGTNAQRDGGHIDAGMEPDVDAGELDAGAAVDAGVDAGAIDAGCITPDLPAWSGQYAGPGLRANGWSMQPTTPLFGTRPGKWDSAEVHGLSVIKVGTTYYGWYAGGASGGGFGQRVGSATSTDGVNWTRLDAPILSPQQPWESASIGNPAVAYDGQQFVMLYQAYDGTHWRVGRAVSNDGVNFTRSPLTPVMDLGSGWESLYILSGSLMYENGRWVHWYGGNDGFAWRIGRATSPDGITWTRAPGPILGLGAGGEPGWAYGPQVVKVGCRYFMLYASAAAGSGAFSLALATSDDGLSWQRQTPYPAVATTPGTAYSNFLQGPGGLIIEGNQAKAWVMTHGPQGYAISLFQQTLGN